ncbi:unnamed protein product [Heligmosomoides polygyrus]|uniref:PHD-type domain-containing protein n=1 Tax=Heligmosomoides polygyrus TaxID=6339 RepID=A0A183G7U0_HELPZ|nr:unnamed protein product [Heligmosomoides polygyrus]
MCDTGCQRLVRIGQVRVDEDTNAACSRGVFIHEWCLLVSISPMTSYLIFLSYMRSSTDASDASVRAL